MESVQQRASIILQYYRLFIFIVHNTYCFFWWSEEHVVPHDGKVRLLSFPWCVKHESGLKGNVKHDDHIHILQRCPHDSSQR